MIVLPNNPNVRLAAENAAAESTKDVRVIATSSVPEGIVAAFAFDAGKDVDANEEAMRSAIDGLAVGEIVRASRDATVDGMAAAEGEFLALLDGAHSLPARARRGARRAARPVLGGRPLFVQVLRGEGRPTPGRSSPGSRRGDGART